ncbi:MAG: hypothetical protein JJT76_17110 [Clostridiaceae bacterium]|nr:hypothetical protein [Clostridiaceae bacterium]
MKKIVVLFFLMLLILGHETITFASYKNDNVLEKELTYQLQETFEKRIEVWNGFLMGGYDSLQGIQIALEGVVGEPLLTIDIETFKEMLDNPTSYEGIEKVDISNCKVIYANNKEAHLTADILWILEGYGGKDMEEITYNLEMKKMDNKWLLTNYEVKR